MAKEKHQQMLDSLRQQCQAKLTPAKMNLAKTQECQPLHYAVMLGDQNLVAFFIPASKTVDVCTNLGHTPLHYASAEGHTEVVQLLLAAGADKEAKNIKGNTPLHYAAVVGHTGVVQLLLAAGADKEAKDIYNQTPLHCAAINGHSGAVQVLLAAGADKEAKGRDNVTPLHCAAINGHSRAVQVLLAAGADKEARDEDNDTPLHCAVVNGHSGAVQVLLDAGADKEAKGRDSDTPLHCAAFHGNTEAAKLLLDAGADIYAESNQTARGIAVAHDKPETAALILNYELAYAVIRRDGAQVVQLVSEGAKMTEGTEAFIRNHSARFASQLDKAMKACHLPTSPIQSEAYQTLALVATLLPQQVSPLSAIAALAVERQNKNLRKRGRPEADEEEGSHAKAVTKSRKDADGHTK